MARYIDAERLKRTFASGIRVYDGMCKIADVMHNIENEPTADVVEVVRCKDCKHKEQCCEFIMISVKDKNIDFCSYGERKEDNDKVR